MTSPDQNYTSWHVGMKVVCIDDRPVDGCGFSPDMDGLTRGDVYTVRRVGLDSYFGIPCVWLNEIDRGPDEGFEEFGEVGYRAVRFRPVQTRKTDISCFTAMLNPKPAKAGKVRV